jgi:hypothetical protein
MIIRQFVLPVTVRFRREYPSDWSKNQTVSHLRYECSSTIRRVASLEWRGDVNGPDSEADALLAEFLRLGEEDVYDFLVKTGIFSSDSNCFMHLKEWQELLNELRLTPLDRWGSMRNVSESKLKSVLNTPMPRVSSECTTTNRNWSCGQTPH